MDWTLELVIIPAGRSVEVSDVEVLEWGSFVYFEDLDGNHWSLQELPVR